MKVKIIGKDPHNPQGVFEVDEKYAREIIASNPNYQYYNVSLEEKTEIKKKKIKESE